jgi:hypothetical protein
VCSAQSAEPFESTNGCVGNHGETSRIFAKRQPSGRRASSGCSTRGGRIGGRTDCLAVSSGQTWGRGVIAFAGCRSARPLDVR